MNAPTRAPFRLLPLAAALALSVALPAVARAQNESAQATAEAAGPALKDRRMEAAERQRFVGEYTLTTPDGETIPFKVWEEREALMGQPGDDEPSRLLYQGDNVFRPEKNPAIFVTFEMEGEKAVRFTAKRGEAVFKGVRKP